MKRRNEFPERLKSWRLRNHLSIKKIAELTNSEPKKISDYENRKAFGQPKILLRELVAMEGPVLRSYIRLVRDIKRGRYSQSDEERREFLEAIRISKEQKKIMNSEIQKEKKIYRRKRGTP